MRKMIACLFVLLASSLTTPASADGRLNWNECYQDISDQVTDLFGLDVRYECTQVNVPLDYDHANGAVISLALVRIPAADPNEYRGSLFVNPGGPGGSGVNFLLNFGPFAGFVWGQVAGQFDLVGFDPRGVARSTALRCFGNLKQAVETATPVPFPVSEAEIAFFEQANTLLDNQCTQRGNQILEHMSTANVARDLDYLRDAVGDDHLNYMGLSYGSFLGQTYANLFPDRVGAFIVDGVLDPIAWANVGATVPFSVALRSDAGARAALDEFLRQCDAAQPGHCALAPNSAARLDAVLERLRNAPILITDPASGETVPYLYSFAVADLLGGLYSPSVYGQVAAFFAFLESVPDPLTLGQKRFELHELPGYVNKRGLPHYPNVAERFPAVACEDTSNPTGGYDVWFQAGKAATAQFGIFGEVWAWGSAPCAVWSSRDDDVYKGPFATVTAHPVLVIGNFYDPATRYEGALKAHELLANSALLSVDEPGHTSLGLNACAAFFTSLYLQDPDGYAAAFNGLVCPSGDNWFDKTAAAATAAAGGQGMAAPTGFRARVMGEIAFRP